jgi:5-methylcytosine-specific restriction endonuclease McrA
MAEKIISKICTSCQDRKPVLAFSVCNQNNDGYQYKCKDCEKIYYQQNKESVKRYRQKNKKRIAVKAKQYREANKDSIAEWHKNHYLENREKKALYIRGYQEENSHRISEYNRERYNNNKQHFLELAKEYRNTPHGRAMQSKHRSVRRCLMKESSIERFDPKEIFNRDGYKCQICGHKTRPDFKNPNHPLYPNLDHIVPLSKGGDHSRKNTQCLCRQCNIEKSNSGVGDQLRMFG